MVAQETIAFPIETLSVWDELDRAAKAVQVAQPSGMTEAAARLEAARAKFDLVVLGAIRAVASGK